MKDQELRDLCSQCWQRARLPGGSLCLPCQAQIETLRFIALSDQLDALRDERAGAGERAWHDQTRDWGQDAGLTS